MFGATLSYEDSLARDLYRPARLEPTSPGMTQSAGSMNELDLEPDEASLAMADWRSNAQPLTSPDL